MARRTREKGSRTEASQGEARGGLLLEWAQDMERIRTGTRMPAVTRVRLGVRVRAHVRCSDVTGERRGPQTQGDA